MPEGVKEKLDSAIGYVIKYIIERLRNRENAPVAQSVERYLGKVEVSSSSLVGSLCLYREVQQVLLCFLFLCVYAIIMSVGDSVAQSEIPTK